MRPWITIALIGLAFSASLQAQANKKMKLLYVYDALCGWCYGFSPVIQQFYDTYQEELEIEVISGGMVTGERVGPIGEVAGYISWAYKDVERATGIKFGEAFLDHTLQEGKAIFTSIPPSVAMTIFKESKPEQAVAFASRLQRAVYWEGTEPQNLSAYGTMAREFGLDSADFVKKMEEPVYLQATYQDFALAQQLQVSGFPTVFWVVDRKAYPIARGYVPFERLEAQYLQAKESVKP